MTNVEFFNLLQNVDIPWRYSKAEKKLRVPYGVYSYEREPILLADNIVYAIANSVSIDIYARTKDELDNICIQLEQIFADNEIVWNSNESHSIDEEFFLNSYNLEV
ncbi:MAG: hypothetical protein KBT03_10455 [Bacteroidales bacterium]|nr:hypothetical protein [Candidatus Scybalousia scybalohippi]